MPTKKQTKHYLRPTGFVSHEVGRKLAKNNNAFLSHNIYFTHIELISRNNKHIKKKIFNFCDFLNILKDDKILSDLFDNINKKNKKLEKILFKKKKHSIFGILNITPDSFSDGGKNIDIKNAIVNSNNMIKEGATFIDIGGESTRPGANLVSPEVEIARVLPAIQRLNNKQIDISLDTRNSSTMEFGILSGATIINDVSGLQHDKRSVEVLKKYDVPVVVMHMPGNPKSMMSKNKYDDVLLDVYDFLESRISYLNKNGIKSENIIIDPGIGFGKDYKQNLYILKNISMYHALGLPIMLGVSRKRFIDSISNESSPNERLGGTIATTLYTMLQGIRIHRVHDVKVINQALKVFEKLIEA